MAELFWGESSGVRALLIHSKALEQVKSKAPRQWTAETLSAFKNNDLVDLMIRQDNAATKAQTSRLRHELAETYAWQRDAAYTTRSRRWLYTRGLQQKLDGAYELWRRYNLENANLPATAPLVKTPEKQLTKIKFETLLNVQP